jgi:ankyrin repeat protein
MAAFRGRLEIFRYLTQKGADINIRDTNNNTAIHFASASDSLAIINSLLDKGMSVNLTDTDEFTPLHISAQFGHLEATKLLFENVLL